MAFDRSKYKKASVESIDETVGKAAATMGGGFWTRRQSLIF